jgi:chromosome segregation ATPase
MDQLQPASSDCDPRQRDLWRQTRQQIHEYDQKAAELQLDQQQQAKVLKSLKEELAQVQTATQAAHSSTMATRREHMELQKREIRVQKASQQAMNDIKALNEQQQVADKRLKQLQEERAAMNEEFDSHLKEQQECHDAFQGHINSKMAACGVSEAPQ